MTAFVNHDTKQIFYLKQWYFNVWYIDMLCTGIHLIWNNELGKRLHIHNMYYMYMYYGQDKFYPESRAM